MHTKLYLIIKALPIISYGYEIRIHTLKKEHTLRLFDNRMLRKISGPKAENITEG
jgi:hypothetical protein